MGCCRAVFERQLLGNHGSERLVWFSVAAEAGAASAASSCFTACTRVPAAPVVVDCGGILAGSAACTALTTRATGLRVLLDTTSLLLLPIPLPTSCTLSLVLEDDNPRVHKACFATAAAAVSAMIIGSSNSSKEKNEISAYSNVWSTPTWSNYSKNGISRLNARWWSLRSDCNVFDPEDSLNLLQNSTTLVLTIDHTKLVIATATAERWSDV